MPENHPHLANSSPVAAALSPEPGVTSCFPCDYDNHARLPAEVARRLLARLSLINHQPQVIVDLGAGTGVLTERCQALYPAAAILAVDSDPAMLQALFAKAFPQVTPVLGHAERLPLASGSVDLVVSNLMLYLCADLEATFAEVARVLAPGGVFIFSTFGPDTLKEFRAAWAAVMQAKPPAYLLDLHDIGDQLLKQGFLDPVMDMEMLQLQYKTVKPLWRDAKAMGMPRNYGNKGLGSFGRSRFKALQAYYEQLRQGQVLPASTELVYGHAWRQPANQAKQVDNEVRIPVSALLQRGRHLKGNNQ